MAQSIGQVERKAQMDLNAYLREKKMYGFFELKQIRTEIFSFAKIEKVQWEGLQATEKNGLVWKLSDEDQRPKPCDSFSVPPLPSYLVIKFRDGMFYFIRFQKIIDLRDKGIISIGRVDIEKIADKIIKVKTWREK